MSSLRTTLLGGFVPHALAILVAAAGCLAAAYWAKGRIEAVARNDVELVLSQAGHDWAEVQTDGLSVALLGTAPDEATRFAALSVAGTVVDASRIIDDMDVVAAAAIEAPEFSIEILKNDDGTSLIGLVPLMSDPGAIVASVASTTGGGPVSDLLETADFEVPSGWDQALSYGLDALNVLPRSKVSIRPGKVAIIAVAKDPEDRERLERRLKRDAPRGLNLVLMINAPRPVVAPFTLRAVLDEKGGRFDACTADTEEARQRILAAASERGITGGADCILGLGTPSTRWGEAARAGIDALAEVGGGTLTLSNADITLVALEGTDPDLFERAAGELEARLPPVFSLNAILPESRAEPREGGAPAPEFSATRSPEGQVQLRGRLRNETTRAAVESFAAAQFGADKIHPATRLDPDLPAGWPKRVLAALEALSYLHSGAVTVTADRIDVRGQTGREDARGEIARVLSARLGGAAAYGLDVTYSESLDPLASIPTPDECIALLNEAGNKRKITFAPGSTDIEDDAQETIDAVADIIRQCKDVKIEIGGHTDSQGREVMNEQLSQARADAVLNAIMARRVLVSNLTAKGYGEARPIADNGTEDGREANRRIEFRLAPEPGTAETDPATGDEQAVDGGESTE
jgi:OOP family OmpA-OmpF porin